MVYGDLRLSKHTWNSEDKLIRLLDRRAEMTLNTYFAEAAHENETKTAKA